MGDGVENPPKSLECNIYMALKAQQDAMVTALADMQIWYE